MTENEKKVEELLKTMNDIQSRVFQGYGLDGEEKFTFRKCAYLIKNVYGYVLRKRIVKNVWGRTTGCIWRAFPACEVAHRTRHFSAELKKIDMTPNDGKPTCRGNCTTRSMAFCLQGIFTYREIEHEQYRLAAVKNEERGLCRGDYSRKVRRNSFGTWDIIMKDLGYGWIRLNCKVRRDNLAVLLREVSYPIITRSSGHVAVVENGYVIDSWDSRHGRCDMILVKNDDIDKIIDILRNKGVSCHMV